MSARVLTEPQRWYALARYMADKILAFVPNTIIPATVATGFGCAVAGVFAQHRPLQTTEPP